MQMPLIKQAKKMGLKVYVVDRNSQCPGIANADVPIVVDISDEEMVLAEVKKVLSQGIGGVVTVGTDFSRTVSRIGEYYEVPVLPYIQTQLLTDKSLMRQKFTNSGLLQPDFRIVNDEVSFIKALKYFSKKKLSVVVKPIDSMGARGVKKLFLKKEEKDNQGKFLYDRLSHYLIDFNKAMNFSRKKKVIIEEVISGKEYSLDALAYGGKIVVTGIADRIIGFSPYFIETGHVIPSQAHREVTQRLKEGFLEAIRVVTGGQKVQGAFKGDIFMSEDNQVIVGEIAGRLSGGYMSSYTYPLSSGINLMEAAIKLSLGVSPFPLQEQALGVVIERAVISKPGKVIGVKYVQETMNCPGVKKVFIHVQRGDRILSPENNLMKSANVIVRGNDYVQAKSYMSHAFQLLQVITG